MATGGIVIVFLLLAIGGPLLVYMFIQGETADQQVVSREAAEQEAKAEYEQSNSSQRR